MSDRQAFLNAIIAEPDKDLPRLIYADALDLGDARFPADPERAEFIRVQCELAKWPCECDSEEERVYYDECRCTERGVLRRRERELLDAHGELWALDGLACPAGIEVGGRRRRLKHDGVYDLDVGVGGRQLIGWEYRRGFVEHIILRAADFFRHADDLRRAMPLAEVTLTTWPEWDFIVERDPDRVVAYQFPGRQMRHRHPGVAEALAAEFPGIKFNLRPAERRIHGIEPWLAGNVSRERFVQLTGPQLGQAPAGYYGSPGE